MSDSNRRHNCFGSVMRILSTVVLFTIAMTFVWIRSSRATAKGSVHHTGSGSVARDHEPMLMSNTINDTREQEHVWTTRPVIIQEPAEEQTPKHHPHEIDEKYVLNNNQNANEITYDVIEKSSNENKNLIDRNGWTTFLNRLGQNISRRLWLLETSEKSSRSFDQLPIRDYRSYQNKKDLEYQFKHDANGSHNIPEAQLLKHFPPTYKIDFNTNPNLDIQQDNLLLQPSSIPAVQNNMSNLPQPTIKDIPIVNEIVWRRIGLMALIKLGLVKLKVIGFIKILFLFLFKLKFIFVILFFKFISMLKFIKFSILPIFFLPLSAFFFHTIMKITPAHTLLIDILNNNNPGISSTTNTFIPNDEEVINNPSTVTEETVLVPSNEIINIPSGQTQTQIIPSSQTQTQIIPSGQTQTQTSPNFDIPQDVIDAFNTLDPGPRPLGAIRNLDFFQMELNSEKCIERIACKIAATGNTGIIPLWINWVLHRVSKSVPSDKLLYYLKAYDDVINEIHMKSPSPDNWENWCFERYDCNNTDTK